MKSSSMGWLRLGMMVTLASLIWTSNTMAQVKPSPNTQTEVTRMGSRDDYRNEYRDEYKYSDERDYDYQDNYRDNERQSYKNYPRREPKRGHVWVWFEGYWDLTREPRQTFGYHYELGQWDSRYGRYREIQWDRGFRIGQKVSRDRGPWKLSRGWVWIWIPEGWKEMRKPWGPYAWEQGYWSKFDKRWKSGRWVWIGQDYSDWNWFEPFWDKRNNNWRDGGFYNKKSGTRKTFDIRVNSTEGKAGIRAIDPKDIKEKDFMEWKSEEPKLEEKPVKNFNPPPPAPIRN